MSSASMSDPAGATSTFLMSTRARALTDGDGKLHARAKLAVSGVTSFGVSGAAWALDVPNRTARATRANMVMIRRIALSLSVGDCEAGRSDVDAGATLRRAGTVHDVEPDPLDPGELVEPVPVHGGLVVPVA